MLQELGDGGIAADPSPAISRSRRFSNLSSFFQLKTAPHGHHRRANTETCLGGGADWREKFRDVLREDASSSKQPWARRDARAEAKKSDPTAKPRPNHGDALLHQLAQPKPTSRRAAEGGASETRISQAQADVRCGGRSGDGKVDSKLLPRWLRALARVRGKNRVREENLQAKDQNTAGREEEVASDLQRTHVPGLEKTWKAVEDATSGEEKAHGHCVSFESRDDWKQPALQEEDTLPKSRRQEQNVSRDHNELVKPVVESMRLSASDSAHENHADLTSPVLELQSMHAIDHHGGRNALSIEELHEKPRASFQSLQGNDHDQQQQLKVTKRGVAELAQNGARVVRECKRLVSLLICESGAKQGKAAAEVRLLARENAMARVALAVLGAIPPLVEMLDASSTSCAHSALLALLNLALGNDLNKATIVIAGSVPKMVKLLSSPDPTLQEAVVAGFLSLSALDRNKSLIGSSGAVPPLVRILDSGRDQGRRDALRALYNLSVAQLNIRILIDAGATAVIFTMLEAPAHAEKALSVLGNLVAVAAGREAVMDEEHALSRFIDILGWTDHSKCQERAVYVLMVIGHHSFGHRQAMVQKGAIPALLEVSLLGSMLTQNRAVHLLECLREDRERVGWPVSAPMGRSRKPKQPAPTTQDVDDGRKVVDHMVQQSLERNLKRIVRRANVPPAMDFATADSRPMKSLTGCSSTKSLPY